MILSTTAAALLLSVGIWIPAPSQTLVLTHESEYETHFQRPSSMFFSPSWEGNTLLCIAGNRSDVPVILRIKEDVERIDFSIPEGRYLFVTGLAATRDGSIAAVGTHLGNDGKVSSFLAKITTGQSDNLILHLQPYEPKAVTIAPDGGMWTVGVGWYRERLLSPTEFNILKHFDSSGKLLATKIVRAQGRFSQGREAASNSFLRATTDRLWWLTNANGLIEFGSGGTELNRFDPPPGPDQGVFGTTFAVSEDNQVLVGKRDGAHLKVWRLDHAKRVWDEVQVAGAKLSGWATLGFDGDRIVVVTGNIPVVAHYRLASVAASAMVRDGVR
jgi:hypothetical protein